MKQSNRFISDMLDLDTPEALEDILWRAGKPTGVAQSEGAVILEIPFQAQQKMSFIPDLCIPPKTYRLHLQAYGDSVLRATLSFHATPCPDADNVMLQLDPSMAPVPLKVISEEDGWQIVDPAGHVRMQVNTRTTPIQHWSDQIPAPQEAFDAQISPDGCISIPFMSTDTFFPQHMESISLGCIERKGIPHRCMFSVHARHDEKFAGTGERFAKMDLSGQTLVLENTDGLGVNSRRAYKNVPFYVSSRPYGLLVMTSAHTRLSLADISRRAAQGLVEDSILDLFFIGGGNVEAIVHNYRKLTGFPKQVPLWSYGTWMSRMTYFSAEETFQVAERLRNEQFPCDVLHLDTGWFKTDWKCEWEFSPERFPDPDVYMEQMRQRGYRISLWQLPSIAKGSLHWDCAKNNRYIAPKKSDAEGGSNFGNVEYGGSIDFSNPQAIKWYQGLLEKLLTLGASAIKTDFGEDIDMDADYQGMPAPLLHNLYCLLYQKAAYEITAKVKGQGIIWARAGWTGCQRYPLHWGGDSACTWDGLAGSIRGGLHLGISGFAFWSHDVPGFHGLPDFMNSRPARDLYIRWTQFGVFTSHLRYHGSSPREPYEYPEVAPLVRQWWNLRYALIPYLYEEGNKAVQSGYPLLRALIFHHGEDPCCWNIDDQFYCGDNLLIAPVMNSEGMRDVYLPAGSWTNFWSGEVVQGPVLLKDVQMPLERIPVYARTGSAIQVYPESVQCTDEMDLSRSVEMVFDARYSGLADSILGKWITL